MSLMHGYQKHLGVWEVWSMTEKRLQAKPQTHLEGPEENISAFAKAGFWEWGPHRDWLHIRTLGGQVPVC